MAQRKKTIKERNEMTRRLCQGIHKARRLMLHEKALHGQSVIIADANGVISEIDAAEYISTHKEFQ